MKSFIGLAVAWPPAIAAVAVFGVAWCMMGAAQCFAGLFAYYADEELESPRGQAVPNDTARKD